MNAYLTYYYSNTNGCDYPSQLNDWMPNINTWAMNFSPKTKDNVLTKVVNEIGTKIFPEHE